MDKKILMQDLADGLVQRKGLAKKEAEDFVRSLFDMVGEFLQTDKIVKIKGLGTFKLVTVDSRESVDVNTGERIVIKEYTKINFTPDPVLRDTINKPFAQFETVVLYDGTDIADMERMDEVELAEKAGVDLLPREVEEGNGETETPRQDNEEEDVLPLSETEPMDADEDGEPEIGETAENVSMETSGIEIEEVEPVGENEDGVTDEIEGAGQEDETPSDSGEVFSGGEITFPEPEGMPADENAAGNQSASDEGEDGSSRFHEAGHDVEPSEAAAQDEVGTQPEEGRASQVPPHNGPVDSSRMVESMHVGTQQIEVQKVEHQTVENQHIVHVAPESHGRRVYLTPWMMFFSALLVLLLMSISYYIGYNHLFYKGDGQTMVQVPDTVFVPMEVQQADTLDMEQTDTMTQEKPDKTLRNAAVVPSVPRREKPVKSQPAARTEEVHPEKYTQVKGGAYEIIGTQEKHRLKSGETLRGLALKYYGSKDFTVYLVVHNKIKNPDLVPEGMWLEIPKLRLKRR